MFHKKATVIYLFKGEKSIEEKTNSGYKLKPMTTLNNTFYKNILYFLKQCE